MTSGARRGLISPLLPLGAAALVGAMVAGAAAPEAVAGPLRRYLASGRSPADVAMTGGMAVLRSPGSDMIRVPAGRFQRGTTRTEVIRLVARCSRWLPRCEQFFALELPQHDVRLDSYWLDRTEVTVADYRRCVARKRCRAIPFAAGAQRFDRPDYPATHVTWQDARRYCAFRGARLPTEAEWERAARGLKGRRYPWGDIFNGHVANHGRFGWSMTDRSDGHRELAPVGSYPEGRTPDGFLDLAGNVAEWVQDRVGRYPVGPTRNPRGPAPGTGLSLRVVRGGHYGLPSLWLRGAARRFEDPTARRPFVGFRCARSAAPRSAAPTDSLR